MILTIAHDLIRELRLNRPPANALSPELIAALQQAVDAAPRDGAQALVISGSPGMFSGGLDVPRLLTLDRTAMASLWRDFYALLRTLAASPIPVAAAITGHAPAGGTVLALFCDWRVAAQGDWRIGLNEVQVGLPLPPVIFHALQRVIGTRQTERLAVRGLLLSPAEALSVGLVDEVAAPEHAIERAVEWCRSMLAVPPSAMSITRRQARAGLAGYFDRDMAKEIETVTASWWSDETQKVLHALAERLKKK